MRKNFKYYIGAWAVLLALFNVIAFVSPGWVYAEKYNGTFWAGYAFITAAFIAQLACANLAFKEENIDKLFYKLPVVTISYTGLIVMFVIAGASMFFYNIPWLAAVICCAIVTALTAIAVVKAAAAGEMAGARKDEVREKIAFIKMATVDAETVLNAAKSDEAREECRKVYEAIRYSDPMSSNEISLCEAKITVKLGELADAVGKDGNEEIKAKAEEIILLIKERNERCKALK